MFGRLKEVDWHRQRKTKTIDGKLNDILWTTRLHLEGTRSNFVVRLWCGEVSTGTGTWLGLFEKKDENSSNIFKNKSRIDKQNRSNAHRLSKRHLSWEDRCFQILKTETQRAETKEKELSGRIG